MNASARCPKCNAVLTSSSDGPICPACLMRGAMEPSDSELDRSQLTETGTIGRSDKWDSLQSIGATTAFADLMPGNRFGEYRIVGRLGRGGMGVVYEADHVPSGRRIALKILAQSLEQPEARTRFLREGLLAASINHPNSVYVYGTEEIDGIPTIAMELVEGGTLAQRVKANGPMEMHAAVDAVLQIIDGLSAAEARGVLHRDVKPSNCFVSRDGTVKVGDYGLSISTTGNRINPTDDVTIEGTFLGTPAFASPEQLRGEPLDKRSDIYAVGVTLFYLMTGKVPFDADNMVHLLATVLDRPAPSIASMRSGIPTELDAAVSKCLQKSPGSRFESYEALRDALLPFSSQSPIPASPGNRLLAGIIDESISWLFLMPINLLIQYYFSGSGFGMTQGPAAFAFSILLMSLVAAYFSIAEWKFGCTLGKWLIGLRVVSDDRRPTLPAAASRAFLYLIVPVIPAQIYNAAMVSADPAELIQGPLIILSLVVGLSHYVLKFGLFYPMRATNGYQAIHDRLTGTRVYERNAFSKKLTQLVKPDAFDFDPQGAKIGPYHRLQTVFKRGEEELVLGYDAKLLRRVWLHLQAVQPTGKLSNLRVRDEPARLRWLGGRRSESERWDCYEVPSGDLLTSIAQHAGGFQSIRIMRRLVQAISTATPAAHNEAMPNQRLRVETQGEGPVTLRRLWVTDLDEIKFLPFDIEILDGDEPDLATKSSTSSDVVDLIQQAARAFLDPVDRPTPFHQSWSAGCFDTLCQFADVKTIDDAVMVLSTAERERTIRLPARAVAMHAVGILFPLMTGLFGFLMSGLYQHQQRQYPQIDQLYEVVQVIQQVEHEVSPDHAEHALALRRYATANFSDALEDQSAMYTLYALYRLTPDDRAVLQNLMLDQQPSPEEKQEATLVYDQIRDQWNQTKVKRPEFPFLFWMSMSPAFVWIEFVWVPSMITGLLLRGGLLMRLFGVVLVNRKRQRASRLRVFFRMFVSGLPALAITVFGVSLTVPGLVDDIGTTGFIAMITALMIVAAGTMLIVPAIRGGRSLSDYVAGTHFMVR